ncbi:MAG: hypothetical protein M1813_002318 [Trichoglossum hirsutum]|jgi:hypothetical protein|nr:MAG: hypothetical protein M1813_002318 [Trichoglossum hirsutum]
MATSVSVSSIQKVSAVGTGAVSDSRIGTKISFDKTTAVIEPLSAATNRGIVHFAVPPPVNLYPDTTKFKLKQINVIMSSGTTSARLDVVDVYFDGDRKFRSTGLDKSSTFSVSANDSVYEYGQGIGVAFDTSFPNNNGAVSIIGISLTFQT